MSFCTPPIIWTCSDAVVGKCVPDKNGIYVTRDQCQRDVKCNLGNITYPTGVTTPIIHPSNEPSATQYEPIKPEIFDAFQKEQK